MLNFKWWIPITLFLARWIYLIKKIQSFYLVKTKKLGLYYGVFGYLSLIKATFVIHMLKVKVYCQLFIVHFHGCIFFEYKVYITIWRKKILREKLWSVTSSPHLFQFTPSLKEKNFHRIWKLGHLWPVFDSVHY